MAPDSRLAGDERARVSCARVSSESLRRRVVRNGARLGVASPLFRCRRRAKKRRFGAQPRGSQSSASGRALRRRGSRIVWNGHLHKSHTTYDCHKTTLNQNVTGVATLVRCRYCDNERARSETCFDELMVFPTVPTNPPRTVRDRIEPRTRRTARAAPTCGARRRPRTRQRCSRRRRDVSRPYRDVVPSIIAPLVESSDAKASGSVGPEADTPRVPGPRPWARARLARRTTARARPARAKSPRRANPGPTPPPIPRACLISARTRNPTSRDREAARSTRPRR